MLLFFLSLPSRAQESLFEDVAVEAVLSAKRLPSSPGAEEGARRSRVVRVDPSRLQDPAAALHQPSPAFQKRSASRLRLNLFPDIEAVLHVERTDFFADGRFVARGMVEGEPDSLVLISVDGEVLAATVSIPGREAIKVRYLGDGLHEVIQLDSSQFRPCNPLVPDLTTRPEAAKSKAPTQPIAPAPVAKAVKTVLDVMVVYTGAARAGAGGDAGIRSLVNLSIAEANDAYSRSLIDAELNLVYAGEVAYTETGNANTDLTRLQSPSDGQMDGVHTLRNQYGADIVCLFTEAMASYAGLGYVMSPPRAGFADYAFSVVRRMYAHGQFVFAHEVGHNLGCQHDRNNANNSGAYAYSYGHRFAAGGTTYRTVMAYAPGVPIPHFSNPSVPYLGVATGVTAGQATAADNAQTINLTAPVAAGFRGQGTVIQMASATVTVSEGVGSASVNVTRSGDVSRTSTVWFGVSNGTAVAGSDFTAVANAQLTFAAGETNKVITVPILDDSVVESPETIRLNLGQPAGAMLGAVTVTTLTIADNDSSLAMAAATASVVENAGNVRVEVRRLGSTAASASVDYATLAGTATAGGDFTATTGTLSFAAGATNGFITIPIADDSAVESTETFVVRLSNPSGTRLGTPTDTTVQILEDDSRIGLAVATANVSENAGQLSVAVTRTGGTAGVSTVAYATANGTATAGSDYTAVSGTLQFNVGEATRTLVVPVLNDAVIESAETFTLTLSSLTGGAQAGAVMVLTATVVDNDSQFAFYANRSFPENTARAEVWVTRTGGVVAPATVRYTTANGTAAAGSDYVATSAVLSFAAGETAKPIYIALRDDLSVEGDEAFTVALSQPTGEAVLGTANTVTVTLVENDLFGFGFSATAVSLAENGGSARLTVTRTGNTSGAATVVATTRNETALAGADYTGVNTVVSFAANEKSKTVDIPVLNDTAVEANESFLVVLGTPTGGGVLGAATTARVTIVENDVGLSLAATAYAVGETTNTVVLGVRRTGDTNATATVDFATADGTATAGSDYSSASGTLSFAAGEVLKTLTVTVLNDSSVEANETFSVRLQNPVGALVVAPTNAQVTILEDDCRLRFSTTNYTVLENAGLASVVVQREGGTLLPASATLRTSDGTATAGSDYTATTVSVSLAAGVASRTVTIPVVNDAVIDSDETVNLVLESPLGASLGTPAAAVLTLRNTDSEFAFYADRSFAENAGRAEVWVTRTGGILIPATVRYSTVNVSATAGSDYVALSGVLSFAVGETAKPIFITLRDDTARESNEVLQVALASPTGETTLGTLNRVSVTLTDNDGGAGAVVDGFRLSLRRPEGKSMPELRIAGPEGARVRLESSTNLTTWETRGTLTLETGEAVWTEPDDVSEGRYYRGVLVEPPGNP